jgi:hypothetical protein
MGHKLANGRVLSDDEFDERLCRQHRKIKADPPQRQQMRGVWPCPGEETRQAPGESCAPKGGNADRIGWRSTKRTQQTRVGLSVRLNAGQPGVSWSVVPTAYANNALGLL